MENFTNGELLVCIGGLIAFAIAAVMCTGLILISIDMRNRTGACLGTRDLEERARLAPRDRPSPAPVRKPEPRAPAARDEREPDNTKQCLICQDNGKRVAASPCGHYGFCFGCSKRLESCPVCKAGLRARVPFFRIYES